MAHSHNLRHRRHLAKRDSDDDSSSAETSSAKATQKAESTETIDATTEKATSTSAEAQTTSQTSVKKSTVFVTASKTFDGDVGGYTTMTSAEETSSTPSSTTQQAETTEQSTTEQTTSAEPTTSAVVATTSSSTEAILSTSSTTPVTSSILSTSSTTLSTKSTKVSTKAAAVATTSSTLVSSILSATTSASDYSSSTSASLAASSASSTASSDSSKSVSKGLSSGAKVGIVIAVLLVAAMAAGGALWFYAKKKRENEELNEKDVDPFTVTGGPMAGSKAAQKAPRLSLRPMTQFFGAGGNNDHNAGGLKELNKPHAMSAIGAQRSLTGPAGSNAWERRAAERNPDNPFKDPSNPFSDNNRAPSPTITITPPGEKEPLSIRGPSPTAAVAGAAAAGAAGKSKVPGRIDTQKAQNQTKDGPGSPESADSIPVSANTMSALANGPGSNNVHRVQLDFKPSMEDELELKAGQVVRILHEYDDGWSLCIRLDRSQQGVCPRTCLSARPVKPRPTNGPNGVPRGPPGPPPNGPPRSPPTGPPNGRPMSPAMKNGPRPASPGTKNGPRPASPASQEPRPASPGMRNGPRPMSPAGGPPRPGTAQGRPNTPRQPSPMGPGAFNQPPRPYSPGPRSGPAPQRSQSPGPYGPPGAGPRPMTPVEQRRRSNSAGGVLNAVTSAPNSEDGPVGWRPQKPTAAQSPTSAAHPPPEAIGQAKTTDDEHALDLQTY